MDGILRSGTSVSGNLNEAAGFEISDGKGNCRCRRFGLVMFCSHLSFKGQDKVDAISFSLAFLPDPGRQSRESQDYLKKVEMP